MKKLFTSLLLLIIILAFSRSSIACECSLPKLNKWEEMVQKNILGTQLIFIGRVISSDEQGYKLQVMDVFKGNIKSDTILTGTNENYCSTTPYEGIWILYGGFKNDEKTFHIAECGISRSLNDLSIVPPVPSPLHMIDSDEIENYYKEQQHERLPVFLKNWINEYALLNAYRNRVQQEKTVEKSSKEYLSYIAIGVSILAFGVALFKKKQNNTMYKSIKLLLLLLFMIVLENQVIASECSAPKEGNWIPYVESGLKYSPFIFIGEVSFSNTYRGNLTVRVVDVFKGKLKVDTTVLVGAESAPLNLIKGGLGIFYASYKNDSTLTVDICGISRSIVNLTSMNIPYGLEEKGIDNLNRERQPLLVKNWVNEYALLNAYRNKYKQIQNPESNSKDYLSYIGIALSALALIVAVFKQRKVILS